MVNSQVAAALMALMAQAPELLARPPVIEPVDVLAAKLPGSCRSKLDATRTHSDQPLVPRPLTTTMITVTWPVAGCDRPASSTGRTGPCRQAGHPRPDGGADELVVKVGAFALWTDFLGPRVNLGGAGS